MLTIEKYKKIFEDAGARFEDGKERFGFGIPKKPIQSKIDRSKKELFQFFGNNMAGYTTKELRDKLYRYFSDPVHKSNLENSFSFESYLLEELRKQDTQFNNKWSYFVPKPIVQYKSDMPFLFRGIRKNAIDAVLKHGEQKYLTSNFEKYVGYKTGYNGVSATTKFDVASSYACTDPNINSAGAAMASLYSSEQGFVLIYDRAMMKQDGIIGIDLNETFVTRGGSPADKFEIKFPQNIPPKYIVGAINVTSGKTEYHRNEHYTGSVNNTAANIKQLLVKTNEQNIQLNPNENETKIARIKALIEKKTKNSEWVFGKGGSSSEIIIYGQKHKVPSGIKTIYDIVNNNSLSTDKLKKIHNIALNRKNQHISFFGLGERQALTRYVYAKIEDIVTADTADKVQHPETHVKLSSLF
jgi:hypothetical protein